MATISRFFASNDLVFHSLFHSFKKFWMEFKFFDATTTRRAKFAIDWYKYKFFTMNNDWKRTFATQEIRDPFCRYVDFLGVFASPTASWLVSGAETSTTRFSFFLSIDWCRFHCDPLSNEWGDTSYWTTYIHTHTHPKSRYCMNIEHRVSCGAPSALLTQLNMYSFG